MTVSAMACINSTVRGSKDPDETEDSGGEELMMGNSRKIPWHDKIGGVSSHEGDTHGSEHRLANEQSSTVEDAFGEVSETAFLCTSTPDRESFQPISRHVYDLACCDYMWAPFLGRFASQLFLCFSAWFVVLVLTPSNFFTRHSNVLAVI